MIFDRKINRLKVVITAVLILLAALFAYIFNDVFEYAEEQLTDFRSSLSTDKGLFSEKFSEASDNIIIISVNDLTRYSAARSSELNLAHWPWSRAVWAEFINFIEKQEPQMVIIDMNFSNYEDIALNRYSPDVIFANTLSNYDNIILATALRTPYVSTNNVVPASILDNFDNPFSPVKESLAVHIDNPEMVNKISYFSHTPIPDIFTQSTTMAVTNLPLSKKTDNIRYSQPVYKLIKGNREYYIPSIGLAALLKYTGSVDEIIIKDNVLRTGNHSIQLNDNGQALGILSLHEALDAAKDKGLDLVEVAANAKPPVCRIMDYSKYKFEKNKKEKEARKKQRQHQVDVKEIKFRPKIEEHDYNVKLKHIRRFLTDGDKVKIVIRYRGREIMFLDSGTELLNKISVDVEDLGTMEKKPEILGKQQMMIIAPKAAK